MKFTEKELEFLRLAVKDRLSEKRYRHTLGVETAAARIGEIVCPEDVPALRAAALLHDIAKELSGDEQLALLAEQGITDGDDISASAVHHSLTAPAVIKRDFPEFATERVLSAVRNHTTGDECMSVFDEIIFLADYIEDGRTYPACVELREWLYSNLRDGMTAERAVSVLHAAALTEINNTIKSIAERGQRLHPRTLRALEDLRSYHEQGANK